jgi:DNA-binding transcriptional LysR family regulator
MKKISKSSRIELRTAIQQISFQDLSLFENVARHTSLSAAARELGLKAPFLTKVIQRIEAQLGAALLHRSATGISLTNEGLEFLLFCKTIKTTIEGSTWRSSAESPKQPSFISVAGPMFLLAHLAAPLLPAALRNEDRGLRLIEMLNSQMVTTESRAHLDAAIHYDELNWGSAWQSYPLGTTEWILCARQDHPLARRVNEAEVLRYPFVVPVSLTGQGFRAGLDNCPVPAAKRTRLSEVSNGEIGLHIVENSDQLIFFPDIQAHSALRDGKIRIVEIKDWAPVRKTVYLSVHQDKVTQRWLQVTIKALEEGLRRIKK